MSIVATRANEDGSFNSVGMNNRTIAPNYKQHWRLLNWCRNFGKNKSVRLEWFHGYEPKPYREEIIPAYKPNH